MSQALPEPPPARRASTQETEDATPSIIRLTPLSTDECEREDARDYIADQVFASRPGPGPNGLPVAKAEMVEQLDLWIASASALIEREAPMAPQAVRNLCLIRLVAYLGEGYSATVRSESIGDKSAEYNLDHRSLFRMCGAKGMLSPWKIRRGGAIG